MRGGRVSAACAGTSEILVDLAVPHEDEKVLRGIGELTFLDDDRGTRRRAGIHSRLLWTWKTHYTSFCEWIPAQTSAAD